MVTGPTNVKPSSFIRRLSASDSAVLDGSSAIDPGAARGSGAKGVGDLGEPRLERFAAAPAGEQGLGRDRIGMSGAHQHRAVTIALEETLRRRRCGLGRTADRKWSIPER